MSRIESVSGYRLPAPGGEKRFVQRSILSTESPSRTRRALAPFCSVRCLSEDYVAAMSKFLDPGSVGTRGVTLVVDGMEQSSVGVPPPRYRKPQYSCRAGEFAKGPRHALKPDVPRHPPKKRNF